MVELLQLVTKIKYLPVASCSLCWLLSQMVHVPNSHILQVDNKASCPAPLIPDQHGFQSLSVIGKKIKTKEQGKKNKQPPPHQTGWNAGGPLTFSLATLTAMLWCEEPRGWAGRGPRRQRIWRCEESPSGWEPYPTIAGGRAGGSQSSRGCWSRLDGGTRHPSPKTPQLQIFYLYHYLLSNIQCTVNAKPK